MWLIFIYASNWWNLWQPWGAITWHICLASIWQAALRCRFPESLKINKQRSSLGKVAGSLSSDPRQECNVHIPSSSPRAGPSGASGWPERQDEARDEARAWSLVDTPEEHWNNMTDRLPQSLEVDGTAQWWLSVHITFYSHRTARNRAPFTEPFWPQTKPFSWGKHHPKSHTPQTHCALPHTTPKVSPVSARSQLLQNKSRRPFFGERLYFPFPRNQPPLAVSSNLSSRGIVSLGLR